MLPCCGEQDALCLRAMVRNVFDCVRSLLDHLIVKTRMGPDDEGGQLFSLENMPQVIDKYEAEHFYTMLEHAFPDVPSFDINKIKAMFSSVDGGIAFERLPELVNVILGQC
mmetsp:Transcript_1406/g.2353  ORF Transcript_1406/g.2353 Transcript_1406/m.2353 type:complete len:111 (+) Transcript_1406:35-367(+)